MELSQIPVLLQDVNLEIPRYLTGITRPTYGGLPTQVGSPLAGQDAHAC
jgi:hypothetical protein